MYLQRLDLELLNLRDYFGTIKESLFAGSPVIYLEFVKFTDV